MNRRGGFFWVMAPKMQGHGPCQIYLQGPYPWRRGCWSSLPPTRSTFRSSRNRVWIGAPARTTAGTGPTCRAGCHGSALGGDPTTPDPPRRQPSSSHHTGAWSEALFLRGRSAPHTGDLFCCECPQGRKVVVGYSRFPFVLTWRGRWNRFGKGSVDLLAIPQGGESVVR